MLMIDMGDEKFLDTEFDSGYDYSQNKWEVIIKYSGDIKMIASQNEINIDILNDNYAIVFDTLEKIKILAAYPQVIYIEQAKLLGIVDKNNLLSTCVTPVQNNMGLSGNGTIIAILDTGLNIKLKEFLNEDGTSRVLYYWDQTLDGDKTPEQFSNGIEYTQEDLNKIIANDEEFISGDFNGHGTIVASIAAGNGRTNSNIKGVATDAQLIIVKLDSKRALTTQLMRGLKYCTDKAKKLQKPLAVNISFGTNNGAHDGKSLFESYIDEVAQESINSIVVATGNEGIAAHHYKNKIETGEVVDVEFSISSGIKSLFLTMWKSFTDKFSIELIAPNGQTSGKINFQTMEFVINDVMISIIYGEPTPYNFDQEIYFQFVGQNQIIDEGIWTLRIYADEVVDGEFNIWLPITEVVTNSTKFLNPSLETTLTLPSTAQNVISVGGYDSNLGTIANFSGRGYTRNNLIKPDLVAPAVSISVINAQGDPEQASGTSLAAPYVTGCAALMMEWGIVNKNSPYLYGQKLKAYLRLGALRKNNIPYPNNQWGYGTLCLQNTFEKLEQPQPLNIVAMNENFINGQSAIMSEDYFEMIVKYNDYVEQILRKSSYIKSCVVLDNTYIIINVPVNKMDEFMETVYLKIIAEWPSVLTLMDRASMDAAGITPVQNQPILDLKGSGVLIGFVDTGIDYTKSNFIYEDNTSKIISIWDQTIQSNPPEGFCYGTEFTNAQINQAINSDNPFEIVPHVDEIGHGTFLASLAAGRDNGENIGAAPDADLLVVKLKGAKNNIRKRLLIDQDAIAFQASDVLSGIEYLYRKALQLDKPIAICIGLGTNAGAHLGESLFEEYITNIARQRGIAICIAAGNEGSAQHHVQGKLLKAGDTNNIEINVAQGESGFVFRIWNFPPNRISISVTSPTGEKIERVQPQNNFSVTTKLPLENTTVTIGYEFAQQNLASQLSTVRLEDPTPGLWIITLYGDIILDGMYYAWLPVTGFINEGTFLLNSTPESTITSPATSTGVITVGGYNINNNNLYVAGSRGPKQFVKISPDFVAPGVNVVGLYPTGYGTMSGTSVSAAITTGACALLLQWGIVNGNQPSMNTLIALSYLIQGSIRQTGFVYPNNQWGYGKLNLMNTFESLKLMPLP